MNREGRIEPGTDSIVQGVFSTLVHAYDGLTPFLLVEQRVAVGQCGDQGHHEHGLAFAGVSAEDGDLAFRDVRLPKPLHLHWLDILHIDQIQFFQMISPFQRAKEKDNPKIVSKNRRSVSVLVLICSLPAARYDTGVHITTLVFVFATGRRP